MNFEVLYLTQFLRFSRKNKIIGCRLFIITLQPLGLEFFNSITKFLAIQYFESFSTSSYLLFFSYMLYNSKWSQFFQPCSQLYLNNESKDTPQTIWDIFSYKCDLVKCIYLVFCKEKKIFVNSNTNILQSLWSQFLKFFPLAFKPSY